MAGESESGLPSEEQELGSDEEEVVGSDEEEERGSSVEGSDEEEEEDDEEGSGSGSDDSPSVRRRPKKKHRPFVAPPPRALPQRTTRGTRMGNAVAEEGDEEFWNQEFFAEEMNDERYETESEPEDRFDADFDESEEEGDEEEEAAEAEAEARAKEAKKKVLKPPGYKKPPLPKPKAKPAAAGEGSAGAASAGKKQQRSSIGPEDFQIERRTVRESTRQKVEEGEMERKLAEKYKPRRAPQRSSNYRPLTQAELLAEAAKTEIDNTKSLQMLVAIEEETKKKAQVVKKRYAGPMVRWKSRRVGEAEMTTLEIRNMAMPDELRHRTAPAPPPPALCTITGQPARYRDPATGLPYHGLEAYRELKRRREAGLLGPAAGAGTAAAAAAVAGAQQQQQQGTPSGAALRQSSRLQQQHAQQAMAAQPAAFDAMQPNGLYQPQLLAQQFQQQPVLGLAPQLQQHAQHSGVPVMPAPAAAVAAPVQHLGGLPMQPQQPQQQPLGIPASAAGIT